MALVKTQLERVGGGLKQLFIYDAGADTNAAVVASGYFDGVAGQINKGDVIHVVANGGGSLETIMVTSARGVTPVTTVRETDV